MTIFFSITGLVLSSILLYFNARRYPSSIYLGLFFFLISLYAFIYEIIAFSKSAVLISIVYQHFGFPTYLIGPVLYFYIRSVLTDNSSLRKKDLLHLIPAGVFLIATLPYLFTPYAYKLEIARHIAQNTGYIAQIQPTVLYRFFSTEAVYLSRPLLVLAYLLWTIGMVFRFERKQKVPLVFKHQRYMLKWISVLLCFLLLLVVAHIFLIHESFIIMNQDFLKAITLVNLISAIGITGLLISPFFFPGILYGLPRFSLAQAAIQPSGFPRSAELIKKIPAIFTTDEAAPGSHQEFPESTPPEKQRTTPTFESDYLLKIRLKVEVCMSEEKPYLQPGCNLALLSKLINIPAHHLAYSFREEKQQPFNEYRNEWRIRHAKMLIREGKAREMTLEAIGLLSGFSTRNTFYIAFKKAEGISPSVFAEKQ